MMVLFMLIKICPIFLICNVNSGDGLHAFD
jgi:hypothetical protein